VGLGSCAEGAAVVCGADVGTYPSRGEQGWCLVWASKVGFDWSWGGGFGGGMVAVGEGADGEGCGGVCGVGWDGGGGAGKSMVGRAMSRAFLYFAMGLGLWCGVLEAQEEPKKGPDVSGKTRPPRVPDAPFVPKRDMVQRQKDQFWAGPQDEGRFVQILTLALLPKEQLEEKLQAWPMYQKLSQEQRVRLVERIDEFWVKSTKEALEVAKEFQLQVGPENEQAFVRAYWTEKMATEKAIREQLSPLRKKLEDEARQRLEKNFKSNVK
jgi:hypothetical protein